MGSVGARNLARPRLQIVDDGGEVRKGLAAPGGSLDEGVPCGMRTGEEGEGGSENNDDDGGIERGGLRHAIR